MPLLPDIPDDDAVYLAGRARIEADIIGTATAADLDRAAKRRGAYVMTDERLSQRAHFQMDEDRNVAVLRYRSDADEFDRGHEGGHHHLCDNIWHGISYPGLEGQLPEEVCDRYGRAAVNGNA